jgi:alkylation response protein AidB-like acyl-CoA dehydrogenase
MMSLALSAEDLAFQQEVRAFVREQFPPERPYTNSPEDRARWAKALLSRGWAAYTWPIEEGGPGWSVIQRYLWERETVLQGVPARLGGMGMMMLAPILQTYGTLEQQRRHLPGILEDRVEWCQGYSEPGAGSDLAAISTRAVRVDDAYIITGEKIWTSWAHIADWMFALVRTARGARPQEGITFLLIDMKSPGVSVAPIITLDGQHTVNRVTLDGVRVPIENRIGDEGHGWAYAKALLAHERTSLAMIPESLRLLALLRTVAATLDEPGLHARIAEIAIALQALEITEMRTLSDIARTGAPGPQSSICKLEGTRIIQALTTLLMEAAGPYSQPWAPALASLTSNMLPIGPDWAQRETLRYYTARTASIAGGSDEVQRNIIAKRILGL